MSILSRKSALLVGGVLAVCAFAAPMASGASWALIGTNHVLSSPDIAFTARYGPTTLGSSCANTEFGVTVTSAAVLTVNSVAFRNCMGTFAAANCTKTMTPTGLPWTATAVLTTNIQIHDVDLDVLFANTPGAGSACALLGTSMRLTGTLTGGVWDPSATGASRRITFNHAHGLTGHSAALGSAPWYPTGSFRDTTGTLDVFDALICTFG